MDELDGLVRWAVRLFKIAFCLVVWFIVAVTIRQGFEMDNRPFVFGSIALLIGYLVYRLCRPFMARPPHRPPPAAPARPFPPPNFPLLTFDKQPKL